VDGDDHGLTIVVPDHHHAGPLQRVGLFRRKRPLQRQRHIPGVRIPGEPGPESRPRGGADHITAGVDLDAVEVILAACVGAGVGDAARIGWLSNLRRQSSQGALARPGE